MASRSKSGSKAGSKRKVASAQGELADAPTPDAEGKRSEHKWSDVALLPTQQGGAGWIGGERFRCGKCRLERRKAGDRSIYFRGAVRLEEMPACP